MKEHWYLYRCSPSSETRGRRLQHDGGCGHWNVFSTAKPLDAHYRPQASPCKECGRRQRLNLGIVRRVRDYDEKNAFQRRYWALQMQDLENSREKQARLSEDGDNAETILSEQ